MPLASSLGLKEPQAPALAQVNDQVTWLLPPVEPIGKVAAATSVAEALTARDLGGAETNRTPFGGGGGGGEEVLPGPLQPAKPMIEPRPRTTRRITLRDSIWRSVPSWRLPQLLG